jgi:methionyl aminopeptidase
VLEALREAGRIASMAREHGARLVVPGARLRDVCEATEALIRSHGGGIAFPVQTSRNHIAAHYCPAPDEDTVYAAGDLAKLDLGVHIDGWVVDTATTVNVGGVAANQPLVAAAVAALEAAIAAAAPGTEIRRVSAAIDSTIRAHGYHPLRNLCGHGVGRWVVHCPPPVPNVPDDSRDRLALDAVIAIEPFVTAGPGFAVEQGTAEVFRLDPRSLVVSAAVPAIVEAIRDLRGLPFARRQLSQFDAAQVAETLAALRLRGVLTAYPPLIEKSGELVAQAEHTLYLGKDGVEVLTR